VCSRRGAIQNTRLPLPLPLPDRMILIYELEDSEHVPAFQK